MYERFSCRYYFRLDFELMGSVGQKKYVLPGCPMCLDVNVMFLTVYIYLHSRSMKKIVLAKMRKLFRVGWFLNRPVGWQQTKKKVKCNVSNTHLIWMSWFYFLILAGGWLVILIRCMIFLSLLLHVRRMSVSTVSFPSQLDWKILCLQNAFLWPLI